MTPTKPEPFLSLGFAAVDWIEHYLVHGPGDVQGLPIELDDEFASFVVKAYRVDKSGARVVRRAFLSRSKGRSKSGLAAMIACFEALGPCRFEHWAVAGEVSSWGYEYEPGEPVGRPLVYAEVLNVATEEGQAGNTYDAIFYMLHPETCSTELLRDFGKIDVGVTQTNLPDRRGFIEPVTSADSSKDGGKSTFIVADETHLWLLPRLKRLHGIMTRNLLKRKIASGWMLETSTMYAQGEDSVAEGTHAYAKTARDRSLLFDHRQAADTWELGKRSERLAALAEAYGPAAEWMNLEAIADSWDDPQASEGEFRRFWLNQPVPLVETESAFPPGSWSGCAESLERTKELKVTLGRPVLAVSMTPDHLTVSLTGAKKRSDGRVQVEVIDQGSPGAWFTDRVIEVAKRQSAEVVLSPLHAVGSLKQAFEDAGLRLHEMNGTEYSQGCGAFFEAVKHSQVRYVPKQPELDAAIGRASKKTSGDHWKWDGDGITALVAATQCYAVCAANQRSFWGAYS